MRKRGVVPVKKMRDSSGSGSSGSGLAHSSSHSNSRTGDRRGLLLTALVVAAVAFAVWPNRPAMAVNRDWSGAASGGGNWTSTSSWFGGTPPTNSITADIARFAAFIGGPQRLPNVNQARSVGGVQILAPDDGSTPLTFTFTGNTLTLGASGISVFAGSGSGHTFQNDLVLGANQTWTVDTSLIVNGDISGSGALSKGGSGTLQLNGIGTWTGSTTIRQGLLQVAGGNALPDAASLSFFQDGNVARRLNLDADETIGGLSNPGATQVTVELDSSDLTVSGGGDFASGLITGTAAARLIKSGSGTLTIRTSNTYAGGTTIASGVLSTPVNSSFTPLGTGDQLIRGTGLLTGDRKLERHRDGARDRHSGRQVQHG